MKLAILAALGACTTLGPMPATTGVSAIPQGRTGVELQAGVIPGFYLSTATKEHTRGDSFQQASGLFDFGDLIPGLLVGTRAFGDDGDTLVEPYAGYRTKIIDEVSVGAVAYGTANRSGDRGASYFATRMGAEVMVDAELIEFWSFLKLHGQLSGSLTRIAARGTYCTEGAYGTDCSDSSPNTVVTAHTSGVYPTGTVQLSFDIARRPRGEVHDVQLAILASFGTMPRVNSGMQVANDGYAALGLLFSLGFGAD